MRIAIIDTHDERYTVIEEYIKRHISGVEITGFHEIKEMLMTKHKYDLVVLEQACLTAYEIDKKVMKKAGKIVCVGEDKVINTHKEIQFVKEEQLLEVISYNIRDFIEEQEFKEQNEKARSRSFYIYFAIMVCLFIFVPETDIVFILAITGGPIINFHYRMKEDRTLTSSKKLRYYMYMILLTIVFLLLDLWLRDVLF